MMLNAYDLEDMRPEPLPARDPSKPSTEQGLYGKFLVRRADGKDLPGGPKAGARYFVLDLTHDAHALPAIRAYAAACQASHPQLAADLLATLPPPKHEPVVLRCPGSLVSMRHPLGGLVACVESECARFEAEGYVRLWT